MGVIVLLMALALGCIAQGAIPSIGFLGGAKWPLLTSVVLYYSLYHDRPLLVSAAALAGVVVDSLSLLPFGLSVTIYVVLALVLSQARRMMNVDSAAVVCGIGGAVAFLVTLATGWWLVRRGLVALPMSSVWWKAFGTGLLGCVAAPPCVFLVWWLDKAAGSQPRRANVAGV